LTSVGAGFTANNLDGLFSISYHLLPASSPAIVHPVNECEIHKADADDVYERP
jgi:hypothetical protein